MKSKISRDTEEPRSQVASSTSTSTSTSTTTTWTIHSMGGPIRRLFSTVEIAKQWAISEWGSHKRTVIIEPDCVDDRQVSFSIHYAGPHEEVFATIAEQQHCPCCGRVIATRSDVNGEWHPVSNTHEHWPKDLEDES